MFSHTKYPNAIGSNSVPPGLAGSAMLLRPAASRGRRIARGNEEVSNFPEKGRTPRIQGSEKLANCEDAVGDKLVCLFVL